MKINQQLIEKCLHGDQMAQFHLYRQCYGVLMSICRRYTNDDLAAASILNEGFLKIFKGLKKYPGTIPFEAWIRKIMINTVIDAYRKTKRYNDTIELTGNPVAALSAERVTMNKADQHFDAERLRTMINDLPPLTNKVFNLFAIDGYSHKEIGSLLEISEGTSKWHVSNARKLLKEMMDKTERRKVKTMKQSEKSA
jgi:RNA polymerase sigma factor (sigma-70 family)